jgi:hypothetical protein
VSVLARVPAYPVLLAAYAVLFVYAANIGEVLPADVVGPMLVAVTGATLALAACALLFRDARKGALLATAVVIVVAFFGHASGLLDPEQVNEAGQLAAAAVGLGLVAVYAWRARGSLGTVTAAANAFALVLVMLTLLTILPAESHRVVRASRAGPPPVSAVGTAARVPDRDIYYIVLDRYGSEWSLQHSFGVSSHLTDDLAARGFQVVPGARSNYHSSDLSISTTLNLDLIADVVDVKGRSTDRTPVRDRLADHEVGRFMRANGYRYVHLGAWWEPTRSSPIADEVLALGKTTEFESVLREATLLPAAERLLGLAREDTHSRDQHRDQALFAFRQVERLAGTPGRKFVFAHILMPHPPYVLAEGGRPVFKQEATDRKEAELLQAQLRYTDERVRDIVDALLSGPDETDPIIVISGDEGPYLCYEVDCVDGSDRVYGIRFGVLRAYYLPGLDHAVPSDDSGVNVFRMILREYFGMDLPDLPNRSYTWVDRDHDFYEFRDVTDRLPLPGG